MTPSTPAAINLTQALKTLEHLATTTPCTHGEGWSHQWAAHEARALQVALASRRPLLLQGKPGCGKTQLAKAIAKELGWRLLMETVHPRMEPQDLLYRFDAVKRLAHAHHMGGDANKNDPQLDSPMFYEPGVLWKALDWDSALKAGHWQTQLDAEQKGPTPSAVVCIDEIDKADIDLPNSLLEVFGERSITLPCAPYHLRWPDTQAANAAQTVAMPPLVLITTNDERMLPAPFLRRCVVLNLEVHADDATWLFEKRGLAHFQCEAPSTEDSRPYLNRDLMQEAARLLVKDQAGFKEAQLAPPGVAEYLDLLHALHQLQNSLQLSDADVHQRLQQLWQFLYRKHGGDLVRADLAQNHSANTDAEGQA